MRPGVRPPLTSRVTTLPGLDLISSSVPIVFASTPSNVSFGRSLSLMPTTSSGRTNSTRSQAVSGNRSSSNRYFSGSATARLSGKNVMRAKRSIVSERTPPAVRSGAGSVPPTVSTTRSTVRSSSTRIGIRQLIRTTTAITTIRLGTVSHKSARNACLFTTVAPSEPSVDDERTRSGQLEHYCPESILGLSTDKNRRRRLLHPT